MKECEFKALRLKAFDSVVSTSEKFNLRPTPLTSRSLAVEELEFCIADLENYVHAIKPASCPSGYKKQLRKLMNLLVSCLTSIQKKRAKLSEIKTLMATSILDTIYSLKESLSKSESDEGELTPEQIALADSSHIKELKSTLNTYKRKFEHNIPRHLANASGAQVVNLPLSVNLDKPIKQGLLGELGIPVKPMSSNGYGSDLGYIFESQMLLAFSRKGAEELAQSDYEFDLENSKETKYKEYLVEYRKELKAAKKELKDYVKGYEGKRMTKKFRARYNDQVMILEGFVEKLEIKVADTVTKTKANFVQRKAGRDVKKLNAVYIDTAVKILAKLTEIRGTKFTLVSNSFIVNPRNSDILLFWFMPTDSYSIINSLSSFNFIVENWDFAWSRTSEGSDEMQSLGLPTKLMNRG